MDGGCELKGKNHSALPCFSGRLIRKHHISNFCQDIHAFGDDAFKDDGLKPAVFHLVKEFLRLLVQGGIVRDEVADDGVGIMTAWE